MDVTTQYQDNYNPQSAYYTQMAIFLGTIVLGVSIAVVFGNYLSKTFFGTKKEIKEVLSHENNDSFQKDIEILVRSFEGKHFLFVEATIDEQSKSIIATEQKLNKLMAEISKVDTAVRFMRVNDEGYNQKRTDLDKLKADESKLRVFYKKQYETFDAMRDAQERCVRDRLLVETPSVETFVKAVGKGGAKYLEELKKCDLPDHEIEKIKSYVKTKNPQT